ncbi:heparanase-like isoform X2 [Belonocnema kinseyi]|uniref:heparanase-like isoform X2 n=1 Tax=Belonocnema kinseyi TaxID=2817044 RepID=UPI00143D5625|nr:heparanase-like isoform X2 [Belonocnema kinseyi]
MFLSYSASANQLFHFDVKQRVKPEYPVIILWTESHYKMSYLIGNDRKKNQYQNLGGDGFYENRRTSSCIGPLVVSLCFIFFVISLWNLRQSLPKMERHIVILNTEQPLLHTTSTMFLSFGLDSSSLRRMKELPISDKKFINLASHLRPAYVRIGGTAADCLFFDETLTEGFNSETINPVDGQDITNFTITKKDLLDLYKFTQKSGNRMLFDLNALIRNSDGSWNDSNARQIVEFAQSYGMSLDWHLGNEPNSFYRVFSVQISAQQLAKDYCKLRVLLNTSGYEDSILVGPEVNRIGDSEHPTQRGENYAKEFLSNDEDCVDFVTWHQYYLNGREAQVQDFIKPEVFNILSNQIKSVANAINAAGKNTPMWLSETGTAFGGGAPEISNRFVAGFLFLDKLGYSASAGLQVVIRQSFFGGNYAMVGSDLTPNPDWWVSVIYKQFVSNRVLKIATVNNFGQVRLYAHCTPEKSLLSKVPAVTVYGMNLFSYPVQIMIQGTQSSPKNAIFLYALTADNLQSSTIKMNGEELNLLPNGDLPPFKPVILEAGRLITLPGYSMVFTVMHGVNISACSTL